MWPQSPVVEDETTVIFDMNGEGDSHVEDREG